MLESEWQYLVKKYGEENPAVAWAKVVMEITPMESIDADALLQMCAYAAEKVLVIPSLLPEERDKLKKHFGDLMYD